ncbi:ribosome biogenesis GTP-binding protein YihA/YsxC [Pueribacillus sp. YX66]|uniref:ribosome biogenesis GTP-binding protein YihA/YsxC n=1 Tax=Pueribacillus sp. YX66 TaxID=3229242 RepID=UPI00358D0A4D
MKVTKADFVISAVKPSQYPELNVPEIALAGRSNVGKSSFINKMINRKNLARTSQKPGKTQTLNFYFINEQFFFVDVPGYGYAKVSKAEREDWGIMIETYFLNREQLRGALLVIDIRHEPTNDDVAMYDWFKFYEIPVIIIATKADKISKGKREKQLKQICHTLRIDSNDPLIAFSAETGEGKEHVWQAIKTLF